MSILQAFILGLLQGIAEFLPISSSGHLLLAKRWFGTEDVPLLFDLSLHVATLVAVVMVFRGTIVRLFRVLSRWLLGKSIKKDREDLRYIAVIIFATFLTGVLGFSLKDLVLPQKMVYFGFLYTSVLLISSSLVVKKYSTPVDTYKQNENKWWYWVFLALALGVFQGIAVLPGISRSGSTISIAIFCGVRRDRAGEMSFLLSIPAILGGLLLILYEGQGENLIASIEWLPFIISLITSLVAGYIALISLMRLIKTAKLHYFAVYLIPLAFLGLVNILS